MKKLILVVSILLIGLFVAGCSKESETEKVTESEVVSSALVAKGENYEFVITNNTKEKVELNFASGQRFDFQILNKNKEIVYHLASVSMFTQDIGQEVIKPKKELSYEINLTNLGIEPGEYVLVSWLTATENEDFRSTVNISIK